MRNERVGKVPFGKQKALGRLSLPRSGVYNKGTDTFCQVTEGDSKKGNSSNPFILNMRKKTF